MNIADQQTHSDYSRLRALACRAAIFLASLGLYACSEAPDMLSACDGNDPETICKIQNPEDMDILPGGNWAIFSEMLSDTEAGGLTYGSLQSLNLATNSVTPLFGKGADLVVDRNLPTLGDAACPGAPDPARFGGHGVDVRELADRSTLLAAVNHGERESIELFTIDTSTGLPIATWRGCIPLDRSVTHNDVAIASNGDLYFTRFSASVHPVSVALIWDLTKLYFGADTGLVYHWSPSTGVTELPNSAGSASNGISISSDDQSLFVAEWGEDKLYRLRLSDAEVIRDEVELDVSPDNFAWRADGKLVVTGQVGEVFTNIRCIEKVPTTCDIAYGVYAVDPDSLAVSKLFSGTGAASVALPVGDRMYVGTFTGDNIQVR